MASVPGSRKEAIRVGARHYYTGKPCKRGHYSHRITSSSSCYECQREHYIPKFKAANPTYVRDQSRRYRRGDPEKYRRQSREQSKRNPEARREANRKWRQKNLKKCLEDSRRWRQENTDRHDELIRKWREENPAIVAAYCAKYRAAKLERTPPWADLDLINKFYECCPAGCHVDHIIPLRGDKVSGLHVPENLQWLPARENQKKCNKWPYKTAA